MPLPRRIGNFDIVRLLATGGMGEVFLARQLGAGGFSRAVVVKRLLPHLAGDAGFVQMFLNEGRLAGMLAHPNIAQLFELGESNGEFFIAMEFVHGRSLRHIERTLEGQRRLLGPTFAARICIEALRGLHAAHTLMVDGQRSAVVHRDMSPDNILVGFNGVSRVIDFGVARALGAASTTRTGTVKGKFAYMAPERFSAEKGEPDPRVDVYAISVVLYEALCGRRPFTGVDDASLIGAILSQPVPEPRSVNPLLDEKLSGLIMRGLARSPDARWPTAEAMAHALEEYLAGVGQIMPSTAIAAFMRAVFGDAEADSNPSLSREVLAPPESEISRTSGVGTVHRMNRRLIGALIGALGLAAGAVGFAVTNRLTEPAPVAVATPEPARAPAPTEKPAPPPSPPTSARKGRVAFRVKPWGEIWQGDRKLGVTPNVTVEEPAGRQTFTVKNPQHPPRDIVVEVLPDTEVSVKIDLTAN